MFYMASDYILYMLRYTTKLYVRKLTMIYFIQIIEWPNPEEY